MIKSIAILALAVARHPLVDSFIDHRRAFSIHTRLGALREDATAVLTSSIAGAQDFSEDPRSASFASESAKSINTAPPIQQEEVSDAEYLDQSRRAFFGGATSASLLCGCAICAEGGNGRSKLFASAMSRGMADYEALSEVKRFKTKLFGNVRAGDDVLEIGIGSAPNVAYYADRGVSKLMALEPNRDFDDCIIQSVAASGLSAKVNILPGYAERIPQKDESVDVVSRHNTTTSLLNAILSQARSLPISH